MHRSSSASSRLFVLIYGVACYALFLGVFAYLVFFTGDLLVPKSVNDGPSLPVGWALFIDLGLLLLFGVQHSVMAREWFKNWWKRIVPEVVERSTYVLSASLCLIVLFVFWVPLPSTLWNLTGTVTSAAVWVVFASGWSLLLVSTFLIDHFEFFGLRQVWAYFRRRVAPAPAFKIPSLYRTVRHPMMLGFLIALWAAPHMTAGRLVLAAGLSVYIVIGIYFEERALLRTFGSRYVRYRRSVPKLIPGFGASGREAYRSERSDAVG